MSLKKLKVDSDWTLFLDRDGVINTRIVDNYVVCREQFEFVPGAKEAIASFAVKFDRIFVVTNQQGIGKGLMTESDLDDIHAYMESEVRSAGGRVDKIYHCPELKEAYSKCRKPEIGMALLARKEFSGVKFKKSIMVGDSLSDMQFGKKAGMVTVLIKEVPDMARNYPGLVDYYFPSLIEFAKAFDDFAINL